MQVVIVRSALPYMCFYYWVAIYSDTRLVALHGLFRFFVDFQTTLKKIFAFIIILDHGLVISLSASLLCLSVNVFFKL